TVPVVVVEVFSKARFSMNISVAGSFIGLELKTPELYYEVESGSLRKVLYFGRNQASRCNQEAPAWADRGLFKIRKRELLLLRLVFFLFLGSFLLLLLFFLSCLLLSLGFLLVHGAARVLG